MKSYVWSGFILLSCLSLFAWANRPVVTLKTRDNTILIKTTANGPLYTVKNKFGIELAVDMTLEQLEAKDEKLSNAVKDAIALGKNLHATESTKKIN